MPIDRIRALSRRESDGFAIKVIAGHLERALLQGRAPISTLPGHAALMSAEGQELLATVFLDRQADKVADKVEVKPAPLRLRPFRHPRLIRELIGRTQRRHLRRSQTVPPAQDPPAAPPVAPPTSEAPLHPPPAVAGAELPSEAKTATETNTAALSTEREEPTIAILLVREEIKSLADLSNKKLAIDASQAGEVPDIKMAISKAGATGVESARAQSSRWAA